MVSGLLGDEVHIRPRSNVFDVVTAPAPHRVSSRSPDRPAAE
jgi:hypothetical protein